jgi:hypothetical protein
VHNQQSTMDILRKISLLALLGFCAITLSGPLLAILGVLLSFGMVILSFALVGLLVWFVVRALYVGHRAAWEGVRELGEGLGRVGGQFARLLGRVLAFPVRLARGTVAGIWHAARFIARTSWSTAKFVGEISLVGVTGVLVGAVVGAVIGAQNHELEAAIVSNAVIGGLIGTAAGIAMTFLEKKSSVRQPTQGLARG